MTWLALDTATDRLSVAVGDSLPDAAEATVRGARRHAAELLPAAVGLLAARGLKLSALTGLAVSDGPGSFTGLRIGASVAKALAKALAIPLFTAPSLMVRAAGAAHGHAGDSLVLAFANALRGEVYAAAYRFTPADVVTVLAPSVWQPRALAEAAPRPDLLVGDAPPDIVERLAAWSGRIGRPDGGPHAAMLLDLVTRPGGARRVADVELWEPEYGRPAEAQARWERAHGRALADQGGGTG
ncbi:MAG TPA: tRNA (adenosine(37)-N6)-threonylcarbamoyltransferase complex dimerization subunit type 1 TsaB [Gemmatimonadales bacterium]|nr:tRNA (adenosine(37)-N6)-threonylcarbamoyltransferase complex dimerization subunit type 1 TsaB [Gemmatimonadales bacterium]